MSHYVVLVALPPTDPEQIDTALAEVMAPFDENKDTDPYRDYMGGEPTDHWLYTALKQAAHDYSEGHGAGIKPYKPDEIGWSSASSKKTEDEQLEEQRKEAAIFANLPTPFTWRDLVDLYNNRWTEEERGETYFYEEETGRAYTLSTYNPQSKWDWYQIGGRWQGRFPVKRDHEMDARLITGSPSFMGRRELATSDQPCMVDGGPIEVLDLDRLRTQRAAEAAGTYDRWTKLTDGLPEARPWSHFVALIDSDPGYTIDHARREYGTQPRVEAARTTDEFRWSDDVIGRFSISRDEYAQRAADSAVPGFAFLDLDGTWHEPGRMGRFGMSTDTSDTRAEYYRFVNEKVSTMPPSTVLVSVDCHI